eukprot:CAMPEP_0119364940 /NCGR_PEP_ID=MMETSP1334-20130426/11865_1 /TAXON_ID=127549 /ORGANISM="Calcidiscus leptoporus, Strain RCC1130" /LENGTH=34 /DNA_ID= /DNA_START= /DNA_END= /DNA_ORIENTATION=
MPTTQVYAGQIWAELMDVSLGQRAGAKCTIEIEG